jgi:hypothetical protein
MRRRKHLVIRSSATSGDCCVSRTNLADVPWKIRKWLLSREGHVVYSIRVCLDEASGIRIWAL